MIETLMTYITIFAAVFTSLSLIRLLINFIRALLSNPPQKFEVGQRALVYYGLAASYLITLIIMSL
jgi:hypothetical protein